MEVKRGTKRTKYSTLIERVEFESKEPISASGKTGGWSCKACTFLNLAAVPNCEVCKTVRSRTWACTKCTFINESNIDKCSICNTINKTIAAETYLERPKVARYPNGSWNCHTCTVLNASYASSCIRCGARDQIDMILDPFDGASVFSDAPVTTSSFGEPFAPTSNFDEKHIRVSKPDSHVAKRCKLSPSVCDDKGSFKYNAIKTYQVIFIDSKMINMIAWNEEKGLNEPITKSTMDNFKTIVRQIYNESMKVIYEIEEVLIVLTGLIEIKDDAIVTIVLESMMQNEASNVISLPPHSVGESVVAMMNYIKLQNIKLVQDFDSYIYDKSLV